MAKYKIGREERNKLIGWMAINREKIENKYSKEIISLASKDLGSINPSTAMVRDIAKDIGIPIRVGKTRGPAKNRTGTESVKVRTLARILIKLHNELGVKPDEDLLIIAGRVPVNNEG